MASARPTDKSWSGKRLPALTTLGWFVASAAFVLLLLVVPSLV